MGLTPIVATSATSTSPPGAAADARGRHAEGPAAAAAKRPEGRSGGGGEGPAQDARPLLGNLVSKSSAKTETPQQAERDRLRQADLDRRERRAARMALRADVADMLRVLGGFEDHALLRCGLVPVSAGGVQLRLTNGRAGFAGLATCGSHACPVCAAKIAAHRAAEVGKVLAWGRAERMTLAMVTLTVRHTAADPLAKVWDGITAGWEQVTAGSQWGSESEAAFADRLADWRARGAAHDAGEIDPGTGKRQRAPKGWKQGKEPTRRVGDRERYGVEGWLKAVEVTHGANGWHVHVHAVMLLDYRQGETPLHAAARAHALGGRMHRRWQAGVESVGMESWRDAGGLDVTVSDRAEQRLADYLTKSADSPEHVRASVAKKGKALAMEATLGHHKVSRSAKGRTPFQIAADAAADLPELRSAGVLSPDLELWAEFVQTSHGRHWISWSEGLRDRAALGEEKDDADVAAEEMGTAADAVLMLDTETWWAVAPRAASLLDATETHGPEGAFAWLRARGLRFTVPEADPHRPPPRE